MKPTDFALHLTGFLTTYLAGQRNASSNTIRSYRDTFVLLLRYLRDVHHRPAEKVTVAFWPGTVVVTVVDESKAIVPVTSAGTLCRRTVTSPVAAPW